MKNMSFRTVYASLALAGVLMLGSSPGARAQAAVPYAQQIYLMKTLKPSIKTIGVMGSGLSDEAIELLARAGAGQGVGIFVARPQNAKEIAMLYKKLTVEKAAEIIWIPEANDKLMAGVGFEYLRENTLVDKVGLCVPTFALVGEGALCNFHSQEGRLTAFVNKRIAEMVGVSIPGATANTVSYVVK